MGIPRVHGNGGPYNRGQVRFCPEYSDVLHLSELENVYMKLPGVGTDQYAICEPIYESVIPFSRCVWTGSNGVEQWITQNCRCSLGEVGPGESQGRKRATFAEVLGCQSNNQCPSTDRRCANDPVLTNRFFQHERRKYHPEYDS